jgi:hypothetical protein
MRKLPITGIKRQNQDRSDIGKYQSLYLLSKRTLPAGLFDGWGIRYQYIRRKQYFLDTSQGISALHSTLYNIKNSIIYIKYLQHAMKAELQIASTSHKKQCKIMRKVIEET